MRVPQNGQGLSASDFPARVREKVPQRPHGLVQVWGKLYKGRMGLECY